jgi:hypothetical protein
MVGFIFLRKILDPSPHPFKEEEGGCKKKI